MFMYYSNLLFFCGLRSSYLKIIITSSTESNFTICHQKRAFWHTYYIFWFVPCIHIIYKHYWCPTSLQTAVLLLLPQLLACIIIYNTRNFKGWRTHDTHTHVRVIDCIDINNNIVYVISSCIFSRLYYRLFAWHV